MGIDTTLALYHHSLREGTMVRNAEWALRATSRHPFEENAGFTRSGFWMQDKRLPSPLVPSQRRLYLFQSIIRKYRATRTVLLFG